MSDVRLLHLYAQPAEHDDAWIVGNRTALVAFAQAIQDAFTSGEGSTDAFTADGEGFTLHVRLDDTPMSSPSWIKRAVPYTDETAREHRPEAVWPENETVPTLKVRVHLYADPMGFEQDKEYAEQRWLESIPRDYLAKHGVRLDVEFTASDAPDFEDRGFDILLCDYSGLGLYGASEFARRASDTIVQHAKEHPSRYYAIVSRFTQLAVEDFLADLGEDPPANLHLDDEEFIEGVLNGTIALG